MRFYTLANFTHASVAHIHASLPVSGVLFFCFPVSAISVFEVSCHRTVVCSWYSVAKTHYMISGA